MSSYHLAVGWLGAPNAFVHYPTHLAFALGILFLADAERALFEGRRSYAAYSLALVVPTVAACLYLILNEEYVANRMIYFDLLTTTERVLGVGLVLVLLEAARRTVGWALVLITLTFLLYARFGWLLPHPFWHRGFGTDRILEQTFMTVNGIFSTPLAVTADFVFLFVLFGALLLTTGAGRFFTDFAFALTGRSVGGPAKTAVIASALMGMLQGSSAGNVTTTGPFTIPAMRRAGYEGNFAAAVEAVASSGGQITPPIMGAAVFLMAEYVGIPYAEIMVAAVIPAALYFLAVFITVDLEARRLDLRPSADQVPRMGLILRRHGYLMIPVAVMILVLLRGYTPAMAGFGSIIALVLLSLVMDSEVRARAHRVFGEAMMDAPRLIASVSVACAVGGVIAGTFTMTGLGLRISGIILDAAGGVAMVAMLLTMVAALVLGMGMPTSAAYVILAALLAPGLVKLGLEPMPAHLFIVYCAAKSSITPPVAVASYAAAALAATDPLRTSMIAFRLGISGFIIPFMFSFGPALLGAGDLGSILYATVTASAGIFALSVASVGWLRRPLSVPARLLWLAASLPLMYSGWRTDLLGLGLMAAAFGIEELLRRPSAVRTE